ncbi:hypothetical protein [Methylocystis parvus]|uniref:hypothetical protein n=1 Tax=Methylocystis parvus TaxID=134 RepID=UPI003C75AF53
MTWILTIASAPASSKPLRAKRRSTGDAVALDVEEMRRLAQQALGQEIEGGVGAFVGVALRLFFLDLVQQAPEARIVPVERDAEARELGDDIRFPRLVGDEHATPIADAFWRHMLIGVSGALSSAEA